MIVKDHVRDIDPVVDKPKRPVTFRGSVCDFLFGFGKYVGATLGGGTLATLAIAVRLRVIEPW